MLEELHYKTREVIQSIVVSEPTKLVFTMKCKAEKQDSLSFFSVFYRVTAIRFMSAPQMFRCMPTFTARIRLLSRRVSNGSVLLRIVGLLHVPSTATELLTSTAAGRSATLPSRTKQIWVSNI